MPEMAHMHGVAGEWARVRGTVLGLWPVMATFALCGFAVALWIFASANWGIALFAFSVAAVWFCTWKGLGRIENFYVGARGEERVASILEKLPEKYHVFNDFAAGRKRVDHVVAGPAGVFAVETKNWRGRVTLEAGKILVDGREPSRSPLDQIAAEAEAVRKTLSSAGWDGTVTPVLAFASDTFAAHVAEQDGIVVMNACELLKCFSTERIVLLPREIDRLAGLMENAT